MSHIEWHAVESSAVSHLGFCVDGTFPLRDSDTLVEYGTAYVRFHSGRTYRYRPVLRWAFLALRNADSIGSTMWKVLVPGTGLSTDDTGELLPP